MWDTIIKGVGTALSGWLGYRGQNIEAENIRKTNEMNERLQREAWEREDNAVQRRKADLEAAGLNPALAAGGASSSGPSVSFQAVGDGGFGALSRSAQEMSQLGLFNQQLKSAKLDNTAKKIQNENLKNEKDYNEWDITMKKLERSMITGKMRNEYLMSQKMLDLYPLRLEEIMRQNDLLKKDDKIKEEFIRKLEFANKHNDTRLVMDLLRTGGSFIGGVGRTASMFL